MTAIRSSSARRKTRSKASKHDERARFFSFFSPHASCRPLRCFCIIPRKIRRSDSFCAAGGTVLVLAGAPVGSEENGSMRKKHRGRRKIGRKKRMARKKRKARK